MNYMLTGTDNLGWLRETHLRGVALPKEYENFKCAILQGNEDSPHSVNLYVAEWPNITDDYLRVVFVHEPPVYCEYIEYDGRKNQPKWHRVEREPLAYTK